MRGLRALALALAMVTIGSLITACNEPAVSADAQCSDKPFTAGDEPSSPRVSLLLVDLVSNDEEARRAIGEAIRPVVTEAVRDGGIVRLVVSGGSGQPMQVSNCLDGKTVLHTEYDNPTRERDEQANAIDAIEGDVSALIAQTRIARFSDVTNLIAEIPDQLAALDMPASAAGLEPAQVVLISDLDSPVAAGDCMSLKGLPASARVAYRLVAQCIELRQYRRLPAHAELQVVRPQLTRGGSNASRMAGFLADSLCTEMSGEEGECPGRGA